ncbi:MAG: transcription termination factor Rho [Patescibacteria group bacterium]
MPRQRASLDLNKTEEVSQETAASKPSGLEKADSVASKVAAKPRSIQASRAVSQSDSREENVTEGMTEGNSSLEKSVEDFIGSPNSKSPTDVSNRGAQVQSGAQSDLSEVNEAADGSVVSSSSMVEPSRPRFSASGSVAQRLVTRTPASSGRIKTSSWSNSAERTSHYRAANTGTERFSRPERSTERDLPTSTIRGILDDSRDGHGVLRIGFAEDDRDAYISSSQIRRFKLRSGDVVEGPVRAPKEGERYWGLLKVDKVNDVVAEEYLKQDRIKFKSLTPVYPDEQIKLETGEEPLSLRIIDMIAPIGKGQRSLIVSPPKAGKTTLLKNIASGVASNNPDIHVMAVLVGERPEEVTDIRRHIESITKGKGEVAASNFDESAADQVRVAELALERAKRLVESGKDVVILLDSITRLARAYNLAMPTSGRTLSGGFDPAALFPPKKFFGAARNFEVQGSLTIVGTALIDTGSRMDDLIYEEFKGTGNQEVHLSRHLAERRIHPAIDVQRSGTRRDDLLIDPVTYQSIATLHRMLDTIEDREERTVTLIGQLKKAGSNKEFLASIKGG